MPLVRLAAPGDYEPCMILGRTMYRVRWFNQLCPGNPTDDPAVGVAEFNEWQVRIAAGHTDPLSPGERIALIAEWCITAKADESIRLAKDILRKYKNDVEITLEFETSEFTEPALAYRYELAFLNKQVHELPANMILKLQNICKGSI